MVEANVNQNPPPYQPWLVPDVVVAPGILHDTPRHPKKVFSKI
jgi:hypothetical protein